MSPEEPRQRISSTPTLVLSEKTAIKLQLGFIGAIIAAIISAVLFLASLRGDVISMITRVAVHDGIILELQKQIVDQKIHSQSVDDNLHFLRDSIEEDQKWHRTHVSDGR